MENKETKSEVMLSFNSDIATFKAPTFEVGRRDQIVKCGEDNAFFDELDSLIELNGMHSAIITDKILQATGEGFDSEDEVTLTALESLNEEEDGNEVLEEVLSDYIKYGGYSLLITWSKDWSKWISIKYIPFNKVRCMPVNKDGIVAEYKFRYDWSKSRQRELSFPAFSWKGAKTTAAKFNTAATKGDTDAINSIKTLKRTQLLHVTGKALYYPIPSYSGCISSIKADIQVDVFAEKGLGNGLSSGGIVSFIGKRTDPQKVTHSRIFKKNYTGVNNQGTVILDYEATKDTIPIFTPISTVGDWKFYKTVAEQAKQKILEGHRVTCPELVGLPATSGFGDKDKLINAQNLFEKKVIKPIQLKVLKTFNKLMKINGYSMLTIKKLTTLETNNELSDKENTKDVDENGEIINK